MPDVRKFRLFVNLIAASSGLVWPAPSAAIAGAISRPVTQDRTLLAGVYDGGQTELATMLELRADGRFRYILSYGALDEQAEGSWSVEGDAVLLTSDPITPPSFTILSSRAITGDELNILLDLPSGLSRQFFDAEVRRADGNTTSIQLGEDGVRIPVSHAGRRPVAVALALPLFGLRSEAAPLTGVGGAEVRFRFDANDLGKVGFARTPLRVENGDLLMTRHERSLRFRRIEAE